MWFIQKYVEKPSNYKYYKIMQRKKIQCPDCHQMVEKSQLIHHVINCKKYKRTYLNNIERGKSYLKQNSIKFLIAQLQISKQLLRKECQESDDSSQNIVKQQIIKKQQIAKNSERVNQQKLLHKNQKVAVKQDNQKLNNSNSKSKANIKKESGFDDFINKKKQKQKLIKQEQQKQEIDYLQHILSEGKTKRPKTQDNFDSDIKCSNCNTKFTINDLEKIYYADLCLHPLCKECMDTYLSKQYVGAKGQYKYPCPKRGCTDQIPYYQLAQIFGKQRMSRLEDQMMNGFMPSLVKCVKCKSKYDFSKGKADDAPSKDHKGNQVDKKYNQIFAEFRFLCPNCKTQQCKQCEQVPFHIGQTCAQFKTLKSQKKCRYCQSVLPLGYTSANGIRAFDDICQSDQCYKKCKYACSKIHRLCNHSCSGFIKQKQCIPCMKQKCALKNAKQLNDQNQDSYCSICYIQGLGSAPCIKIKCGHIFHYQCLEKRFKTKWFGPRILFNFCHCPLCNTWIQVPEQAELFKPIQQYKKLEQQVKQKAHQRLKFQQLEKDQKLTDKQSPYYDKPEKYAMAIYAYFQCFKCKKPYYGGRKNCAQAMNDQNNQQQFKPEQLVCPQCCPIKVSKNCKKHGKQFVSFKCKFCCSIAQWFCWGSTHFCDSCHNRQIKGQYLNKLPRQKLPKCQGPGKCPAGGDHGLNGQTLCLGCGICINDKNSVQSF